MRKWNISYFSGFLIHQKHLGRLFQINSRSSLQLTTTTKVMTRTATFLQSQFTTTMCHCYLTTTIIFKNQSRFRSTTNCTTICVRFSYNFSLDVRILIDLYFSQVPTSILSHRLVFPCERSERASKSAKVSLIPHFRCSTTTKEDYSSGISRSSAPQLLRQHVIHSSCAMMRNWTSSDRRRSVLHSRKTTLLATRRNL